MNILGWIFLITAILLILGYVIPRKWLETNEVYFKTFAAALLSLMAVIISIYQANTSNKQTELMNLQIEAAKTQIESSKVPVLEATAGVDKELSLINMGGAALKNIEIVAFLSANYNSKTEELSHYNLERPPRKQILKDNLLTGEEFALPFSQLTKPVGISKARNEMEAFAVVFRYRRAADMRPYYNIVCFVKTVNTGGFFYTLDLAPGVSIAQPDEFKVTRITKRLRERLREICIINLGLPINTE